MSALGASRDNGTAIAARRSPVRTSNILLALLSIAAIAYQLPRTVPGDSLLDFGSLVASAQAAHEGQNPYGIYPLTWQLVPGTEKWNPNLSPPISAVVLQVLRLAEPHRMFRIWYAVSVILYAAMVLVLLRRYRDLPLLPAGLWAFAFTGFWETLVLGHVYVPLACAAVGAWLLLERGRDVWAGVLIGFLVAMKPNFAVWPVLLLLGRNYRPALTSFVVAAALSVLPVIVYGVEVYAQWFAAAAAEPARLGFATNASFSGYAVRVGLPWLGVAMSLAVLAASALWAWWRRPQVIELSGVALVVSLLASPVAWIQYEMVLLPLILSRWHLRGTAWMAALLVVPVPMVADGRLLQTPLLQTVVSLYNWTLLGLFVLLVLEQISALSRRRSAHTEPAARPAEPPIAAAPAPLLSGWQWVVTAFVMSRVLLFTVVVLSRQIMVRGELWHPGGLLSVLEQFDGELWYMTIARDGYWFSTTEPSPVPFFPMFPILMKLVSFVFHDMRIAAFVVPHVCLFAAAFFLKALVDLDYETRAVGRAAVLFLLFNPVSIFHSSAYSESTFLMFGIGAMLAARRGQWLVACLAGMCLAATRNVGVLIALPLAIEYAAQVWRPNMRVAALFHPRVLLLGLVPLGLAAYMFYGYLRWNDPFAFLHASAVWGRSFTSPGQTLSTLVHYRPLYKWLFLGTMATALLLLVAGAAQQVRTSYLIWSAALTATYLCAATMEAWPRYLSVEFPLYIILGVIVTRASSTYEPLVACTTALFVLCAVLSANGYWFT